MSTTKIYKEHYTSPQKAKEAAAHLRKSGCKARVSKVPRDRPKK